MKLLDKQFLALQFRIQIYEKNGSEYQRFFENIMEKAYSDFRRIKPYGREGDAGNDGYCKTRGVYYQVYAPDQPVIKEAEAARKLKRDFEKLKKNWDEIAKIKEYYFVYNNKYAGSTKAIEEAISYLRKENPGIQFDTFLTHNLENTFFELDIAAIQDLGFNVNLTEAVANAYTYLSKVEIELDRENALFAVNLLNNIHDIIDSLNDDQLNLEYKILEGHCLQKLEKIDEAMTHYENLIVQFPLDPRPMLYLSEIYIKDNDLKRNEELLDKAEDIDSENSLLKFMKLVRASYTDNDIDVSNIYEESFPDDNRVKADLYRLYAIAFNKSGDATKANSFIQKAIHLNPNKLIAYINKISFRQGNIFRGENCVDLQEANVLLTDIEMIEKQFVEFRPRIKVILNAQKLEIYNIQKRYSEYVALIHETLQEIYNCYPDAMIDEILFYILTHVKIPNAELTKLINVLTASKRQISDNLAKSLIYQFAYIEKLIAIGIDFFTKINFRKYIDFINQIKNNDYDGILACLKDDIPFAFGLAASLKSMPDLRKKIIESLPDDKDIQKKKLLLLLNYDKDNIDEAFDILKGMDLSQLDYLECRPVFEIAREKQAWDLLVKIIEKRLVHEENIEMINFLKCDLFHTYFHLGKYPKVIEIGTEILANKSYYEKLDARHREMILARTIISYHQKGEFNQAKQLLLKYPLSDPSFEFKITIEAEIYLANNEPSLALQAVVEGVKAKKALLPDEYSKLYPLIAIKIANALGLKLESLSEIEENSFVKFKDEDGWYFTGDDNALDAIRIGKTSDKFPLLIHKKVGDSITFESKYDSAKHARTIEKIFSTELYISWKSADNFHKLAADGLLDGVQVIEVPEKDGTPDLQNLKDFFNSQAQQTEPVFEMYHRKHLPLAMLSASEGGIQNALNRIQCEGIGFVNCCEGTAKDLKTQTSVAENVISNKTEFYIDGTSLYFLLEFGILKNVCSIIPFMKIPQSVINFLYKIADRLRYQPGQKGYMQFNQDEISILPMNREKRERNLAMINDIIQYFESNSECIGDTSLASKVDCPSEKNIPGEFCDACILAQRENIPILTEDFLFLKWNELESNKKAPAYFSSIVLLRVLYERKLIRFEEFLDYFEYLSHYRFKFLSFSSDDIKKAVLGDKKIMNVKPANIRKLNFPLTLSQEYGVNFQTAFVVVFKFLICIITDNAVLPNIAEKLFIEIIEAFPTKLSKIHLGHMFIETGKIMLQKTKSEYLILPENKLTRNKLDRLEKLLKIYDFKNRLWKPKTPF